MFLIIGIVVKLVAVFGAAFASEIMFIIPTALKSHNGALQPIYRELSLRGHNVTAMTVFPMNDPALTNLTEIDWGRSHYLIQDVFQLVRKVQEEGLSMEVFKYSITVFRNITEEQFLHPSVDDLLRSKERKFDLVIIENLALAYYFFANKYDCPIVLASSMPASAYILNKMGNFDHKILYPDQNLGYAGSLSFPERVYSVLYSTWFEYQIGKLVSVIDQKGRVRFDTNESSIEEIERNRVGLVVETRIPVFHKPRALVPGIISINGLQINPEQPLPKVTYL